MIRIALVGAGIFAKESHRPAWIQLIRKKHAELKAIWSRSHRAAAELVHLYCPHCSPDISFGQDGLDALLHRTDIDAVVIAVPIPQLAQISRAALAAGKHVLAEKPLAASVAEALEVLENYRLICPTVPMYCIAENFRFEDAFLRVKDIVRSETFGCIVGLELSVHSVMPENSKYARGWRIKVDDPGYVGGQILDSGVHMIAGLRVVLGSDVKSVTARTRKLTKHLPNPDTVHALLEFENGISATVCVTFAASTSRWELTVLGTKARAALSRCKDAGAFGYRLSLTGEEFDSEDRFIPFTGIDKEMAAFVNVCETGQANENLSALSAFNDVAAVEAMMESCAENKKVQVKKPQ